MTDTVLTAGMPPVLAVGQLTLDTLGRVLTGPAGSVRLDLAPFLVLRALMRRPGVVVSLEQLIGEAWPLPDLEPENAAKAMRMRVRRARDALEQVGVPADRLRLRFEQGYVIEGEPLVARLFTRSQDALLRRLLASHPDRAAAAELAA